LEGYLLNYVLSLQIENRLYERQAARPKIDNFAERLPPAALL
jgi:hypothetical protein